MQFVPPSAPRINEPAYRNSAQGYISAWQGNWGERQCKECSSTIRGSQNFSRAEAHLRLHTFRPGSIPAASTYANGNFAGGLFRRGVRRWLNYEARRRYIGTVPPVSILGCCGPICEDGSMCGVTRMSCGARLTNTLTCQALQRSTGTRHRRCADLSPLNDPVITMCRPNGGRATMPKSHCVLDAKRLATVVALRQCAIAG